MRRWMLGIAIALLILLTAGAIAITCVLSSDYPRKLVQETLAQRLKMQVSIARFHTGWGGHAEFGDISLTLPLDPRPLAVIDSMKVDHTALIRLMLTRRIEISSVIVDGAHLRLAQDAAGRWNLLDVLDRLEGPADKKDQRTLPRVRVNQLDLSITTSAGKTAEYRPVELTFEPRGASMSIHAQLPGVLTADGTLDRGEGHAHHVVMGVTGGQRLVQPWWPDAPSPLDASVVWTGRFDDDGHVTGTMNVKSATAGDNRASGTLQVRSTAAGGLVVEPRGFTVTTRDADVNASGGTVVLTPEKITASQLVVSAMGATARVNGEFDVVMQQGRVSAAWTGKLEEPRLGHEGTIEATVTRPLPGRVRVVTKVDTRGTVDAGEWALTAETELNGQNFADLRGPVAISRAQWKREGDTLASLKDLKAELVVSPRELGLTDMHFAEAQRFSGEIIADRTTKTWRAQGKLAELALPEWSNQPLSLSLDAHGDPRKAEFHIAQLRFGKWTADASGTFIPADPKPLAAEVALGLHMNRPVEPVPAVVTTEDGKQKKDVANPPPRWGEWAWRGKVGGHLSPLDVKAVGEVQAENVVINGRPVPVVRGPLEAEIHGSKVQMASRGVQLWGGVTGVAAQLDFATNVAMLELAIANLDIEQASPFFFKKSLVHGTLGSQVRVGMPLNEPLASRIEGTWTIDKLEAGVIAADKADGRIRLERGIALLEAVRMTNGRGRADGRVTYDLNTRRELHAEAEAKSWPLKLGGGTVAVTVGGKGAGSVDVDEWMGRGKIDAKGDVIYRGQAMGVVTASGKVEGRTFVLDRLETKGPMGTTRGHGTIALDNWTSSEGELTLEKLDVASLIGALGYEEKIGERIDGLVSGTVVVTPSLGKRDPEPLRIEGRLEASGLAVRGMPVESAEFVAYAGKRRVILQESLVHIDQGEARVWANVGQRASGWYYDAQMNVARLDANTLNHAIRPSASPIEGKLGGKVQVLGPVNDPAAVTGNASLRLTESDLVHADMLSQVFRGLGLMKEVRENRGYGNMRMRLEGGALVIDEFRYYNRGAYIFGDGRVDNIAAGGHSPIHMEIVGSTRPFKRANFPGANLLDQFLMNLEATVSSVRVAGTVSQPKVELRTLEDAHRALVGIFGKAERAEASPVD